MNIDADAIYVIILMFLFLIAYTAIEIWWNKKQQKEKDNVH